MASSKQSEGVLRFNLNANKRINYLNPVMFDFLWSSWCPLLIVTVMFILTGLQWDYFNICYVLSLHYTDIKLYLSIHDISDLIHPYFWQQSPSYSPAPPVLLLFWGNPSKAIRSLRRDFQSSLLSRLPSSGIHCVYCFRKLGEIFWQLQRSIRHHVWYLFMLNSLFGIYTNYYLFLNEKSHCFKVYFRLPI